MSFVTDVSSLATAEAQQVAPRKPRLHHLDHLQVIMVSAVVYWHVNQVFTPRRPVVTIDNVAYPEFSDQNSTEFILFGQHNPNWKFSDYSMRFVMLGRQWTIPLLFWICGSSLAMEKGLLKSSFLKLFAITGLGIFANLVLWVLGPLDDRCSYWESINVKKDFQCSGFFFDSVVAAGAGVLYGVLFQFWLTVFLMIFLVECMELWEALRASCENADSVFVLKMSPRVQKACFFHWSFMSAFYVLMTFWLYPEEGVEPPNHMWRALFVGSMEIPFMFCLWLSAALPSTNAMSVRMCQYMAAVVAVFQFNLMDISKADVGGPDPHLDGRYMIYFHMFKQMMSLGYIMTLTRHKTAPIVSRAYPIGFVMLVIACPFTNYYRGGGEPYPWLPFLVDRLLWSGGAFLHAFVHDRIGNVLASMGTALALPPCLGVGAMLAYMFHPVVVLAGSHIFAEFHPGVSTSIILFMFCTLARFLETLALCSRKTN